MKREFLQEFKVNGENLPKDVIDAIMAENGRDIEHAKVGAEEYEAMRQQLEALQAQNPDKLLEERDALQQQLEEIQAQHEAELDSLRFQHLVGDAISAAGGRSQKAIAALLDLPVLKDSENREDAVKQALAKLKEESGYLFQETAVPPVFAAGTGLQQGKEMREPTTLAGALREKMERMN